MNEVTERAIKAIKDFRISAGIYGKNDGGRTMNVDLSYPRNSNNINELIVNLSDVRASDGIKIHYDFERDGWVIMQSYIIEKDMGSYIDAATETWEEVGFFQSWALEHKGSKIVDGRQ